MTLHDQLHELTDDVGHAPPPPDLWERGRRWQRSRRLGTATVLAVACLLAVAFGSLTWVRATPEPAPASYDGQPALPDEVFEPSRWLPEDDLYAPLVAIRFIDRGAWWWQEEAVVGISATTGEYRVLPLPDHAQGAWGATLSPDGTKVAYWTAGTPSGDPQTSGGQSDPVAGVAVYDTLTGDVRHAEIETEHGLAEEGLAWADSGTLLVGFGQWAVGDDAPPRKQGSAYFAPSVLWDLDEKEPHELGFDLGLSFVAMARDGVVMTHPRGGRGYELFDVHSGRRTVVRLRAGAGMEGAPGTFAALSDGGRLAVIGGPGLPSQVPNKVTAGQVPAGGGAVEQHVLPGTARTSQLLGWADEHTLVITRRTDRTWERAEVARLDVRTGERERLVSLPAPAGLGWEWADDHLDAPVVPGREPASPLDPRVVWFGSGLLVLGTFVALRRWRSRVRP